MFARSSLKNFPHCEHEINLPIDIVILGRRAIIESLPDNFHACRECLQAYSNKYCVLCIFCECPIMPLERIAEFNDLKRGLLYAHDDCAPPGNRKIWGEGKPLEPESSNLMKKYTPDRTIIN